ncbi:MAG: T9SS type A sorting domain-containing protein [Bacteroidales bacterium]|nr:T9SS type A sorting domain-containing protein [Bacteroidales bacterium]
MKKLLILGLLATQMAAMHAQTFCENYCMGFENALCMDQLSIDTSAGTIWQIGIPQKSTITEGIYSDHVIITDTINPYPIANHSFFILTNIAGYGDIYGFKTLYGCYNVQTDSLNDFGQIEFSPDNGLTWIDLVNDTVYDASIEWYQQAPVLTGNSNGWKSFEVLLADNGSVFGLDLGDTILYRFSFTSDSTAEELDGLAFDQICFMEFVEGISEIRFFPIKSRLYPNPATTDLTIEFENADHGSYELAIYTIQSKLVFTVEDITGGEVHFNTRGLDSGVYVYKLTNIHDRKRSWGKFIISE